MFAHLDPHVRRPGFPVAAYTGAIYGGSPPRLTQETAAALLRRALPPRTEPSGQNTSRSGNSGRELYARAPAELILYTNPRSGTQDQLRSFSRDRSASSSVAACRSSAASRRARSGASAHLSKTAEVVQHSHHRLISRPHKLGLLRSRSSGSFECGQTVQVDRGLRQCGPRRPSPLLGQLPHRAARTPARPARHRPANSARELCRRLSGQGRKLARYSVGVRAVSCRNAALNADSEV